MCKEKDSAWKSENYIVGGVECVCARLLSPTKHFLCRHKSMNFLSLSHLHEVVNQHIIKSSFHFKLPIESAFHAPFRPHQRASKCCCARVNAGTENRIKISLDMELPCNKQQITSLVFNRWEFAANIKAASSSYGWSWSGRTSSGEVKRRKITGKALLMRKLFHLLHDIAVSCSTFRFSHSHLIN